MKEVGREWGEPERESQFSLHLVKSRKTRTNCLMNAENIFACFCAFTKYRNRVILCVYSSDCSAMEAEICCNGKLITGEDESERKRYLKQSVRLSFHFIQRTDNLTSTDCLKRNTGKKLKIIIKCYRGLKRDCFASARLLQVSSLYMLTLSNPLSQNIAVSFDSVINTVLYVR